MIRHTLRLLRSAPAQAIAVAPQAAVKVDPYEQFFSQENLQSIVIPEIERPANLDSLPDDQFEVYFEKLMNNPLFQIDPELTKAYREYENSFKDFENLEILPHIPDKEVEINWEFYKNFIEEDIVDGFKESLESSVKSIESWTTEELAKLDTVESDISASLAEFDSVIPEIDANLKVIQGQLDEITDFKNRLTTITMEELLEKNPDIVESVYQDITESEWMVKDRVGDETIYNLKHHGGGH